MHLDASRPEDEMMATPLSLPEGADVGPRMGIPPPRPAPPSRPPLPAAKSPSQTKKQIPRVSRFFVMLD
jgi:hypothetical protein